MPTREDLEAEKASLHKLRLLPGMNTEEYKNAFSCATARINNLLSLSDESVTKLRAHVDMLGEALEDTVYDPNAPDVDVQFLEALITILDLLPQDKEYTHVPNK